MILYYIINRVAMHNNNINRYLFIHYCVYINYLLCFFLMVICMLLNVMQMAKISKQKLLIISRSIKEKKYNAKKYVIIYAYFNFIIL